jgi:hypothetical protein
MASGSNKNGLHKRDPAFLRMAVIAGVGGVMAIGFSIGFPIWGKLRGEEYTPAFSLFAAWGIAALAGAYACYKTYLITDGSPRRPPPGGVRLALVRKTDATPIRRRESAGGSDRRAA